MRYQQPLANKMLDSHSDKKDPNHKKESRPSRGSSHQSPCYFSITKVQVQDGVLLFQTPLRQGRSQPVHDPMSYGHYV